MSKNNKRLDKKNRNLTDSLVLKRDSSCRGNENCTTTCYPNCKSGQECVSVWECGNCSVWQCIDNKIQLQVTATEFHTNNNDKRTILIAGLTTGLVCIIVGTIGVFAFYKRRRRRRPKLVEYHDDEKSFSIEPITPIKPAILPPSILDWTQQYDPFIIGAQSLQIPHLDDTPDPLLKRSSTTTNNNCVKTESSMTRVGSISSFQCAKPTLVRIDTVIKKDECGIIRKTSIKTVIDPSTSGTIDFYLCPPPSNDQENTPTSSKSTLGDGSITVFLESPPF